MNNNLILISGSSATGKSLSLRNIPNHQGIMYLNTEAGKQLPFPNKFKEFKVVDPYQILQAFDEAKEMDNIHTIVIDSLTFMMDAFETQHVLTETDTYTGWSNYAQFFKKLLQQHVAESTKNVIFTAHTLTELNKENMELETKLPIKGSLKNNGIEAYFSTVISTKKMTLKELEPYSSKLLNITAEESILGFKYVFQTKLTKETVNERIRSNIGMWEISETFIDNDAQLVLERLKDYYA